ncbi:hypothetical protein COEREDRAFT_86538 [Coemansia reversa NRRL 1564]|uniref:Uncharacterized protein n=1 Tax=Coemansia reversa (strain ATCC 12441 / NRRL 1564) TaxID=763665 RepID=A0A2G5BDQ4_COERN|nr:hypothetical protein COEREDRAFT_86538 [Coemansia reversa NRRL 1564]|eukprot:PIA17148.1 hypothetical protein COEREDRAFT_86538 [Coemansia reversa NRRL 1564]
MNKNKISGTIVEVHEAGTNKVTKEFFMEDLSYEGVELKIDTGDIWIDGLIYGKNEPSYGFADRRGNLVDEDYFNECNSANVSFSERRTATSNVAAVYTEADALREGLIKCKVYRFISYPCKGAIQHFTDCAVFVDMAVKCECLSVSEDKKPGMHISKCRHIIESIYKLSYKTTTEAGKSQLASIQSDFKQLHADLVRQCQQQCEGIKFASSTETSEKCCLAKNTTKKESFLASTAPAGKCYLTGGNKPPVPTSPKPKLPANLLLKKVKECDSQAASTDSKSGLASTLDESLQTSHCSRNDQSLSKIIALNAKVKRLTRTVNTTTKNLHKQELHANAIENLMEQLVLSRSAYDAAEARAIASEKKNASLQASIVRLNKEISKKDIRISKQDTAATINKEIAKKDVEIAKQEITAIKNEVIAKKNKKIAKIQAEFNEASIKLKGLETELARLRR